MELYRKLKIATKISIIIGAILMISFISIFAVILSSVYDSSKQQAEAFAAETSKAYAHETISGFEKADSMLVGLRTSLMNSLVYKTTNRQQTIDMLKSTLKDEKSIFAIYTVWEPNTFDGKDSKYVNKPGHDTTGRFIPYLSRNGENISFSALTDYETPGVGDYYLLPKNTRKTVLVEPYIYNVNGKDVLMTSLAMPIIKNDGTFVGMIGVDFELALLQEKIKKINVMGGYATLISQKGIYLANGGREDYINKNILSVDEKNTDIKNLFDQISTGKEVKNYMKDDKNKSVNLHVFEPIHLDGTDTYWSLSTVIPMKNILAEYNSLFKIIIIVSILSFALIIFIVVFTIKKIIFRLGIAANHLGIIAKGDYTNEVQSELLVIDDEVGDIAKAIVKLQKSSNVLIEEIKNTTDIMASSTEQMSAITEEIASSSENQSAGAEETLSSMEELDASIQNIAKNVQEVTGNISDVVRLIGNMDKMVSNVASSIKEVNDQASNTIDATVKGSDAVEKSEQGMNRISGAVGNLVKAIKGLGKSAVDIGEIVDVIDDIAEQTNLLALNAAIEAARAGEHGKGFAVVAGAIRSLAEKSGEATKEIAKLIRGIQEEVSGAVETAKDGAVEVEKGVELAKETEKALVMIKEAVDSTAQEVKKVSQLTEEQGKAIKEIVEASKNINELSQTMAATVEEQTASSAEVVKAIESVSQSAGQIATGTGEIAQSTEGLAQEAQKLIGILGQFKLDRSNK